METAHVAPMYSVKEVAKRLSVSVSSVRRYICQGRILVLRVGHTVRVAQTDLDEFIQENTHRVRASGDEEVPTDQGRHQ